MFSMVDSPELVPPQMQSGWAPAAPLHESALYVSDLERRRRL